jgi:hypothetical protein
MHTTLSPTDKPLDKSPPPSNNLDLSPGFKGILHYDPEKLESPDEGLHNQHLESLFDHWVKGKSYRDRSTIMAVPAISNPLCKDETEKIVPVPPRVVQSWLSLQTPANQKFTRVMIENCEVADAYNQAVSLILNDPGLSDWKYFLTVETDNIPPPNGLLQLIEDIETSCRCGHIQADHKEDNPCCGCPEYSYIEYDAIGGLYWAKGPGGSPMCYGVPGEIPRSYRPWIPPPNSVSECSGLGMGFTLFRIEQFRRIKPPWFRTIQEWVPGIGERQMTQDMYFFNEAAKHGYRFACSTNVRVGHLDGDGVVW